MGGLINMDDIGWPWWGGQKYGIVTRVTSNVGMSSIHLAFLCIWNLVDILSEVLASHLANLVWYEDFDAFCIGFGLLQVHLVSTMVADALMMLGAWASSAVILLTHWGWVMHICISKIAITSSDNFFSPGSKCLSPGSSCMSPGFNCLSPGSRPLSKPMMEYC